MLSMRRDVSLPHPLPVAGRLLKNPGRKGLPCEWGDPGRSAAGPRALMDGCSFRPVVCHAGYFHTEPGCRSGSVPNMRTSCLVYAARPSLRIGTRYGRPPICLHRSVRLDRPRTLTSTCFLSPSMARSSCVWGVYYFSDYRAPPQHTKYFYIDLDVLNYGRYATLGKCLYCDSKSSH